MLCRRSLRQVWRFRNNWNIDLVGRNIYIGGDWLVWVNTMSRIGRVFWIAGDCGFGNVLDKFVVGRNDITIVDVYSLSNSK